MSGMQPGIPDVAYVVAAGIVLGVCALAAGAQLAWQHFRRWWSR